MTRPMHAVQVEQFGQPRVSDGEVKVTRLPCLEIFDWKKCT
jgi:hypothetical protein